MNNQKKKTNDKGPEQTGQQTRNIDKYHGSAFKHTAMRQA